MAEAMAVTVTMMAVIAAVADTTEAAIMAAAIGVAVGAAVTKRPQSQASTAWAWL